MEARNLTYDQQQDVESHAPYLKVWVALLVLTVLEYGYARLLSGWFLMLVVGLMAMAAVKAALVGLYFMHVKFEGRWVYLFIVPSLAMAAILVVALVPDMALHPYASSADRDGTPAALAPADPGSTAAGPSDA